MYIEQVDNNLLSQRRRLKAFGSAWVQTSARRRNVEEDDVDNPFTDQRNLRLEVISIIGMGGLGKLLGFVKMSLVMG